MTDYIDRQYEYIEKRLLLQTIRTLPTWFCDPGAKFFDGPQPPMEALLDPDEVIQTITGMPSADVAPVRHGYWKTKDGRPAMVRDGYVKEEAYCSVCGSYLDDSDEYDVTGNYCSHCGARMDGGQNESRCGTLPCV